MNRHTPTVVLCLGLPGSASTWIYNICILLMSSPEHPANCGYVDRFASLYEKFGVASHQSGIFVIKSHSADEQFFDYVCLTDAKQVLTIRDPRDCIVSLMEQFGHSFDVALRMLVASCNALMRFQSYEGIVLRYEDQFFNSSRTILKLCQYLRLTKLIDVESLMQVLSQESIMEFINSFDQVPSERIEQHNEHRDSYDTLTHWHTHHFGDGLVGKWKARLSSDQQARANEALAPALHAFNYENVFAHSPSQSGSLHGNIQARAGRT